MKRTPLTRKTPLKNKAAIKRSPSHGRPPGNRSKIPPTVREAVVARSKGRCEARVHVQCQGAGRHLHHKLMRSAGGKHTEENLIDVCLNCHGYIHAHPEWAYENGFLIHRTV